MDSIRAGPGYDVDVAASFAAEFGAVVCRLDFDFLNGVHRWREDVGLVRSFLSRNSVEKVLVIGRVMTVHAERTDPGCALCLMPGVSTAVRHARRDQAQLHEVTGGKRQIDNAASLDETAHLRVTGLQHDR